MVSGQAIVHDRAATEKAAAAPMTEAEFEAFYRRTSRPLWAYVVRITGDPATADDVVQKAFYHFLRAKRNTTNEAQLRAYVFKIATNLTFDHFRQKKRESGERIEDERGFMPAHDLRHDVQNVFAKLKPRERALLWMAHVEEIEHHEIATALGVGAKSVKVLLFRARKKLAELLHAKGLGPEVTR